MPASGGTEIYGAYGDCFRADGQVVSWVADDARFVDKMWELLMNGIGDLMAAVFEMVGIAAFVKYMASKAGKKCGCPVRQRVMNHRFFGLWLWLWDWRWIFWCPCDQL